MNERTLHVLEYDKIMDQLMDEAASSLGIERIREMYPSVNIDEINRLQQETDEAAQVLRQNFDFPFGGITDIRSHVHRSTIDGMLKPNELLQIINTLYGGRNVKQFIEQLEIDLPHLTQYANGIESLRELEDEMKRVINEDAEVHDHASSTLRSIRSQIRSIEGKVRDQLQRYTRTHSSHLSEGIVTIRNDRYVLPVKSESRATIGGIVHDQSASGQTLFMEPRVVVEMNNTLQQAQLKEQAEIERILREISKRVADRANDIQTNIDMIAALDFIHARAKLGRNMRASMPTMNEAGIIQMEQARHPLIPTEEVVANDIELGTSFSALVITGPNTGGKTVTLKLVGLCILMAQSGLQVPALDGSQLSVFTSVFADIGDEQSIEQNLSTFSSHMTNIVTIMEHVDERSLILFDELGSGTDPQEGAALAMALLDDVIRRKASVIATTHYPELKAFGYNRKHVMNASVEFNVDTLQPTYRLLIGIPGRSNAFDISKRLGLANDIIEEAKTYIDVDSTNVNEMIESLEASTSKAKSEYHEISQILKQSEQLRNDLQTKWNEFEAKKEKLYERAEARAKEALQKAQKEAEQIVDELRKKQVASSFKEHEWIETKKQFEQANLGLTTTKEKKAKRESLPLKIGDDIILLSANQKGSVLEHIKDDEYLIQVGIIKVTVKREDIKRVHEPTEKPQPFTTIRRGTSTVRTELDLRGERYEDALMMLEKYVDDALLAGHRRVQIIHGKGTGVLRKGVQQFVKQHPHITSSRIGEANEGGEGVTVIEL